MGSLGYGSVNSERGKSSTELDADARGAGGRSDDDETYRWGR
jgi:hypothetical protein